MGRDYQEMTRQHRETQQVEKELMETVARRKAEDADQPYRIVELLEQVIENPATQIALLKQLVQQRSAQK